MNYPTDAEWIRFFIIESLKSGNPEPLIKLMREDGNMSQFSDYQFEIIEKVLRGENLKEKGRPKSDQNRNTQLLFEVAWANMEGYPLSDPKSSGKVTAFDKASEALNHKVSPERAKRLWDECDREFFRKSVQD